MDTLFTFSHWFQVRSTVLFVEETVPINFKGTAYRNNYGINLKDDFKPWTKLWTIAHVFSLRSSAIFNLRTSAWNVFFPEFSHPRPNIPQNYSPLILRGRFRWCNPISSQSVETTTFSADVVFRECGQWVFLRKCSHSYEIPAAFCETFVSSSWQYFELSAENAFVLSRRQKSHKVDPVFPNLAILMTFPRLTQLYATPNCFMIEMYA